MENVGFTTYEGKALNHRTDAIHPVDVTEDTVVALIYSLAGKVDDNEGLFRDNTSDPLCPKINLK